MTGDELQNELARRYLHMGGSGDGGGVSGFSGSA